MGTLIKRQFEKGNLTKGQTDYTRALFGALALDYPGLEKVKAAVRAEDWNRAETAYLDFCRTVEQPRLCWNPHGEDRFELRAAAWDFFSEDPGGLTWRDRQRVQGLISRQKGFTHTRTQGTKPSPYTLVELADMLLDNKVFMPGSPEDGVQDLGPEWNWEHQPAAGTGRRWTLSLPYQYFLRSLGQAYWLNGDERYIAKLVEVAVDYVGYVDGRSDWIWIPDMQLALNYQQLAPFMLSWSGLAARDYCAIQGWLATGCAASLEAVEEAPGNQLLYNGLGLLWLGIGLPQCRRAPHWRQRGFAQLSAYFGAEASYPDGASHENAYGYVVGASFSGLKGMQMAQDNGWECPKGLVNAIERRASFLAAVAKPDGTCVWSGDGQRGRPLPFVGAVAKIVKRPDLAYVASGGTVGKVPLQRSVYFPYGGIGVMASGWDRQANYLYFDAGPLGAVHGHEGKLAIEVAAWGRSLVEDLGIHSYSREARERPWYRFFGQTSGHNSVTVDGQSQMRLVSGPRVGQGEQDNLWRTSPRYDFMVGHYREGYGAGHYTEPMGCGLCAGAMAGKDRPLGAAPAQRAFCQGARGRRSPVLGGHRLVGGQRRTHLRAAFPFSAGGNGGRCRGQKRGDHYQGRS